MKIRHNTTRINRTVCAAALAAIAVSNGALADEAMTMPMPASTSAPMDHSHHAQATASDHTALHDHAAMQAASMPMRTTPSGGLPTSDGAAPGDYADYGITLTKMHGDPLLASLQLDQFESVHTYASHNDGAGSNTVAWDGRFWLGRDIDKLWLRSEGDHGRGGVSDGDVEAFWGHAIAPFWDVMAGMRHDLGDGPTRNWAALGVQGVAPYEFETEATFYLGPSGRSAFRLKASQDWLFTQKLILMPEVDLNAYGRSDRERDIGAGISDVSLGLRLRYEIVRKFAPYVGVNWVRKIGVTANYARDNDQPVLERQLVAGARIWF